MGDVGSARGCCSEGGDEGKNRAEDGGRGCSKGSDGGVVVGTNAGAKEIDSCSVEGGDVVCRYDRGKGFDVAGVGVNLVMEELLAV